MHRLLNTVAVGYSVWQWVSFTLVSVSWQGISGRRIMQALQRRSIVKSSPSRVGSSRCFCRNWYLRRRRQLWPEACRCLWSGTRSCEPPTERVRASMRVERSTRASEIIILTLRLWHPALVLAWHRLSLWTSRG